MTLTKTINTTRTLAQSEQFLWCVIFFYLQLGLISHHFRCKPKINNYKTSIVSILFGKYYAHVSWFQISKVFYMKIPQVSSIRMKLKMYFYTFRQSCTSCFELYTTILHLGVTMFSTPITLLYFILTREVKKVR